MGLSIHYSGRFNPESSLKEMIYEIRDIVKSFDWNYHVFEENFPPKQKPSEAYNEKIYGISFTPPECETVWLCFLSNGRMSNPLLLEFWGKATSSPEKDYLFMLSTKTQYAGPEIHKLIIHLFKYLDGKYLSHFKMIDEGQFWETGDEKLLLEVFARYNSIMDNFSFALNNFKREETESFEDYFKRLMVWVHKRQKGNNSNIQ